MWDRQTAAALAQFFEDQRSGPTRRLPGRADPPGTPDATRRTLGPRDNTLKVLANGQSLAVLKGTAVPYDYNPQAAAGTIRGLVGEFLPSRPPLGDRPQALRQVLRELARDWGISFDVDLRTLPENALIVVAEFVPRRTPRPSGYPLSGGPGGLARRAPQLHKMLAEEIRQRCRQIAKIVDFTDRRVEQKVEGLLAGVVLNELEGACFSAEKKLKTFQGFDNPLAARFFSNYLSATGRSIELTAKEALIFDDVMKAVAKNMQRFKEESLVAPKPPLPDKRNPQAIHFCPPPQSRLPAKQGKQVFHGLSQFLATGPGGAAAIVHDDWKVDITGAGIIVTAAQEITTKATEAFAMLIDREAKFSPIETPGILLGAGASHVTSRGIFELIWRGDNVLVRGNVTHIWTDEGYDFNQGALFSQEAKVLQRHGKAKPFCWWALWRHQVEGELAVIQHSHSRGLKLPPSVKWQRFETQPLS